jgi:hypothetical protein
VRWTMYHTPLACHHGAATYLVDQRLLLRAQARLGLGDRATTLRHYSHAVPLNDTDAADQLDGLLNGLGHEVLPGTAVVVSPPPGIAPMLDSGRYGV